MWFEPAGSPPLAQFVENRRCRTKPAAPADSQDKERASCRARRSASVRIVTLVIGHGIDSRPFRQGGRLIEDQSPVLDPCSKRAHTVTVRLSLTPGKRSGRSSVTPDWRSEVEVWFRLQNVSKTEVDLSGISGTPVDARAELTRCG